MLYILCASSSPAPISPFKAVTQQKTYSQTSSFSDVLPYKNTAVAIPHKKPKAPFDTKKKQNQKSKLKREILHYLHPHADNADWHIFGMTHKKLLTHMPVPTKEQSVLISHIDKTTWIASKKLGILFTIKLWKCPYGIPHSY